MHEQIADRAARKDERATHEGERISLRAADDYPIAASHFAAKGGTRGHVVVAGAVGVPQRFYRRFAQFAAAAGFSTLTFDYRGIARSAPPSLKGFRMDYFDWARLDLAAAVSAMSPTSDHAGSGLRRSVQRESPVRRPDVPLYVVGHSFGGHAVGLLPQPERVSAMFTFGTGAGWHGWMSLGERIKVLAMWHVLGPLLTRWKGYLAWSLLGMGEDVPLDFYRRWKRWCRHPRYFFDDPSVRHIVRRFARVRAPLMAANATDDRWSPPRSRDAFISGYRNAARQTLDIEPARYGLESIGHFGYFRPDAVRLWEFALAWLHDSTRHARADRRSVTTQAPWRSSASFRTQATLEGGQHGIDRLAS